MTADDLGTNTGAEQIAQAIEAFLDPQDCPPAEVCEPCALIRQLAHMVRLSETSAPSSHQLTGVSPSGTNNQLMIDALRADLDTALATIQRVTALAYEWAAGDMYNRMHADDLQAVLAPAHDTTEAS